MELQIREYEDWVAEDEAAAAAESKAAEEEELLLMREDEAGAPMKTWLVPEVCNMDRCIHAWYMDRIVQEMNSRLAGGDLSLLLGLPVVSERVAPRDLRVTGITYWRLNRADFLADVDLSVPLAVESDGEDSVSYFGFCMTLWFNTDEGFSFEVQDLYSAQTKPERSLWKLDEHLVPVLRRDEVEIAAERLWENALPDRKDPKERTPAMLAEALGLRIRYLRLRGQNGTKAILFFQPCTVETQEESLPGEDVLPAPVPVRVEAGTIVVNGAAAHLEGTGLDILHECIHHEWHLLFYRLQKFISTGPAEIRYKKVQNSTGRRPADPIHWMERQADHGALALLLPRAMMRNKAWRYFQQASTYPPLNGYFNHPGFRWDKVIRRIAGEYTVKKGTVKRRLVMLGHPAARGAANFVDGRYITPFAFTEEYSDNGKDTLVIGRKDAAALYHRSRRFREILGTGDFVAVDGHICLNDPQYLLRTENGLRLTAWANAHADICCLRFSWVYIQDRDPVLTFGMLNSSEEYNRRYNEFLDRRMKLTARERAEKRDRLMRALPNNFADALCYLMDNADGGKVSSEELAARAQLSRKTIERYRSPSFSGCDPDAAVAICLALHLPPWLSRILLGKAGIMVCNYGPRGHYGEILDCCFMDTLPEVQEYLRAAGYPRLKLQDS